jgi:hypothetical protein
VISRFVNAGVRADLKVISRRLARRPGGAGDIRRGIASDSDPQGYSFIRRWSASTVSARRPTPQEIGERTFPSNDAEAGNIATKGELLRVRTERGCRFIRLYGLN